MIGETTVEGWIDMDTTPHLGPDSAYLKQSEGVLGEAVVMSLFFGVDESTKRPSRDLPSRAGT